jgi:hypothetical protein
MNAQPAALALVTSGAPLAPLGPEFASAERDAAASRAENTRPAYTRDFDAFKVWCADKGSPRSRRTAPRSRST